MPLTSGIGGRVKDFISDTFRREVFVSKIKAAIGYISGMSKANILLFGSFLCILLVTALVRLLPLRWGFFLTEFDPHFQYRIADYVARNGYAAFFRWHDDMSWYPFGRTVYMTAFPALGFTAAALYSFLRLMGLNVTVLQVCIVFPVVWGVLTVIAMYQLGKDTWSRTAGLFAALFLALDGSHISRTSLGFFDDETIGVLTMVVIFLLYLRAISPQRTAKSALTYGVMCGLSLAYLSCGWGVFRYVMVLLYLFTALLVLLRRYNTNMLIAFIPTYTLQLAIASRLPYLGAGLLTEWSTFPVFGVLALLVISEVWKRVAATRIRLFTVAGIGGIVCAAFLILWYGGFATSLMVKLLATIDPALRLNMPLIESVAEHRPATWASFFHESGILLFLSIFGFVFVAQRARDSDIFLLLFGLSSVYFAGSLVRLTLILAPALSIFAAVTMVELTKPAVDIIREAVIFPRRKIRFSARVGREFGVAILLVLILVIMPTFARVTKDAYSPATVVTSSFPTTPKEGEEQNYQDWLEALSWMKENLPRDAVVMSWWDYGYWITTYAEKRTLADNGTINSTQIAMIARAFILNETMSVPILKEYNVSNIAVYAAYDKSQQQQIQFYGVGEDSKWYWMAKICNGTIFRGQKIIVTENRTESDTLYYRKVLQNGKLISSDLISDKQGIKPNTVVGYLVLKAAGLEYSDSEHFTPSFNSKKSWVAVYSIIYPETSVLDFSITPKKTAYNESLVALSGRISTKATGLANMTVILEYSGDNGQNWNQLATVQSDRQGAYKYTWTPNAGSYLVRARWDGIQRKFSAAKSTSFELAVDKARVTLSVEPSAPDVPAKQAMTITCRLSKPITVGTITVDYSLDNKTWSAGGYGAVKNGVFTLSWTPPTAGKYYVRVVWSVDQNYVEIPAQLLVITAR